MRRPVKGWIGADGRSKVHERNFFDGEAIERERFEILGSGSRSWPPSDFDRPCLMFQFLSEASLR